MVEITKEEYYKNLLDICFTAMTEDDAHVGLLPDQWKEVAKAVEKQYPKPRVYYPYVPDIKEIEKLKNRPEWY